MHPNLLALVALMGMALSLLSGKLVAYGMEKRARATSFFEVPTRTVRRARLGGEARYGSLSCLLRQVQMDEPFHVR